MNIPDYKNMSANELKSIILDMQTKADNLMDRISELNKKPLDLCSNNKQKDIILEYAEIKNKLKVYDDGYLISTFKHGSMVEILLLK